MDGAGRDREQSARGQRAEGIDCFRELYPKRRNSQNGRIFQEQGAKLSEQREFFCVLFRFGIYCRFVEFPASDIATGNSLSPLPAVPWLPCRRPAALLPVPACSVQKLCPCRPKSDFPAPAKHKSPLENAVLFHTGTINTIKALPDIPSRKKRFHSS